MLVMLIMLVRFVRIRLVRLFEMEKEKKFPLAQRPSDGHPINTSRNFPVTVSAESPSN